MSGLVLKGNNDKIFTIFGGELSICDLLFEILNKKHYDFFLSSNICRSMGRCLRCVWRFKLIGLHVLVEMSTCSHHITLVG